MRYHGTNSDGEPLTSMYVEKDGNNPAFGLDCSNLPSLTRQEFAEECDINVLMEKYEKQGIISHINPREPQYLDLVGLPDLQTAHHIIQAATAEFMALPAKVRAQFENDPMQFVKFAENPENIDQMRAWGLAAPAKEEPKAPPSDAPPPPPGDNPPGSSEK